MASSISMMESLSKLGFFNNNGSSYDANTSTENSTADGNSLPDGFMDSLLASAGFGFTTSSPLVQLILFLHRQVGVHLGIDPSLLLTLLGVLWGAQYFISQLRVYVGEVIESYLMCSIMVGQQDDIYDHLMLWLSKQPKLVRDRSLTAQTVYKSAWEEDDEAENEEEHLHGLDQTLVQWTATGQGGGGTRYLNFSNQARRSVSVPNHAVHQPVQLYRLPEAENIESNCFDRAVILIVCIIGPSIHTCHGFYSILAQWELFQS